MKTQKLSQEEFLKSFNLVPRIAVDLLIKNKVNGVILVKRKIPPEFGLWHLPGGFILKGEIIFACLQRIAKKEVNLTMQEEQYKLFGVFENLDGDPRGHVIDLVYEFSVEIPESKDIKYFYKVPEDMGFNQDDILTNFFSK